MAYHHIDNGGYTVTYDPYGSLVIDTSSQYYNSSITIHPHVTENVVTDALFQQIFHRLVNELTEGTIMDSDPLMARFIDAVAEMEIASLPSYIRSDPTFVNTDGRVIDSVHLEGINQQERTFSIFSSHESGQRAQEYLDNQKSLSMDERYMLAYLSTDPLYCRASTILRYEHQQVWSLL